MSEHILRFFHGLVRNTVFRIYVTVSGLLCVRMADRPAMQRTGLAGAIGDLEEVDKFNRQMEEMSDMLGKRSADGIRSYLKAGKNRGYILEVDDLEEMSIDYVGKWKIFLFGNRETALILRHRKHGKLTFVLAEKTEMIIALFELREQLGDAVEVAIDTDPYQKGLKKYEKGRNS